MSNQEIKMWLDVHLKISTQFFEYFTLEFDEDDDIELYQNWIQNYKDSMKNLLLLQETGMHLMNLSTKILVILKI